MFLREYLYVDIDKVAGLASQLYDGVPEKATNLSERHKSLGADLKFVAGERGSQTHDSVEKSLGDALFKDLEADLEAQGLLTDMSESLANLDTWDAIDSLIVPGRIIRVTASGTLFHPSQMSNAVVGLATSAHGMADMGIEPEQTPSSTVPPRAKSDERKRAERAARQLQPEPRFPEDMVPPGDVVPFMELPRSQLVGMIRVIRGVFGEGVHLHLRPAGVEGPIVSARLEDGRRFLDSSPEVLMSRYGLASQEWTVVGAVGQLGVGSNTNSTEDVTNADGTVNRAKFVDLVHEFLAATAGLVDLPRHPGFSVVPLAVYRAIGFSAAPGEVSS